MPTFNNNVFDQGLNWVDTNGTRIDITVGEAADYNQATGTYNGTTQLSCGNSATTTGAPVDAASGRKVTVAAVTSGSVTSTQTATHWALTDGTSTLIATGTLSSSQAVTSGNTFTLDAIEINLLDPSAV